LRPQLVVALPTLKSRISLLVIPVLSEGRGDRGSGCQRRSDWFEETRTTAASRRARCRGWIATGNDCLMFGCLGATPRQPTAQRQPRTLSDRLSGRNATIEREEGGPSTVWASILHCYRASVEKLKWRGRLPTCELRLVPRPASPTPATWTGPRSSGCAAVGARERTGVQPPTAPAESRRLPPAFCDTGRRSICPRAAIEPPDPRGAPRAFFSHQSR
jgi:hypothetical protein